MPSASSRPPTSAVRIGHGVRLVDAIGSPDRQYLVDAVRERGLHLEVCPTSNVHTGAAASIATHPIIALWRAGIALSYHTDNRLMSCVSMTDEAARLVEQAGFGVDDLLRMASLAARASFLPSSARDAASAAISAWPAERVASA